jgi:hypothetical protein
MLDKLKADFDGIIELVNKTPTPLQEMAFKMILEQWFSANTAPKAVSPAAPPAPLGPGAPAASGGVPDAVKPFLTANGVTTDILEKVFHPTGPGAQLLASSIPGNAKASKLVSLALLLCVKQALETGSFTCTLKELRELAVHYDCYDSANFSATLKASKNYYKPRDKGADLELSGPGLKKACSAAQRSAKNALPRSGGMRTHAERVHRDSRTRPALAHRVLPRDSRREWPRQDEGGSLEKPERCHRLDS